MDAQWPAQPPGLPPRVPAQPIPEDAAGPFGAGTARSVAPHVPGGFSGSEATRLLCAGTYLDPVFRRRVIEELVEHEERPVPPSLGIDVVPVLSHALRARRHDVLTALLLLAVWVTFFALGFSGVRDHADTLSTLTEYGETPSPGQFAGLLFVSWAQWYAWVCVALWGARAVRGRTAAARAEDRAAGIRPSELRRWTGTALTYSARLLATGYWFAACWAVLHGSDPGPVLFPLLLAAVTAAPRMWAATVFRTELHRDTFAGRPRATLPDTPRYQRIGRLIDREQYSALTIYDPFRPFVGAGLAYEPWSFALELRPRKTTPGGEETAAPAAGPLTSRQILDLVRPQLERLKQSSAASRDRLRDLELQECVYLPTGVRRDQLDSEYAPEAVARHLAEAVDEGAEARRLFLRIRVGAWNEQVVTTLLVRVHTQGGMLVLEVAPHVLTPIRPEFKLADVIAARAGADVPRQVLRILVTSPAANVEAGVSALRALVSVCRVALSDPRQAYPDAPNASVRELGSTPFVHLFQEMDVSRYVKTVQDRIINGVRAALRSQGYATDEFEQQVVNVSGNGVFIGGSMSGGAIATGSGAKAQHGEATK